MTEETFFFVMDYMNSEMQFSLKQHSVIFLRTLSLLFLFGFALFSSLRIVGTDGFYFLQLGVSVGIIYLSYQFYHSRLFVLAKLLAYEIMLEENQ